MSKPNKLNYRGSSKVIAYLSDCANWLLDNLSNVIANPSDAATDDLTKIQIGDTIYNVAGGSSTASGVSYDNTTSGLTADNVQEAIDEVQGNVEDMIPLTQKGVASGVAELDSNGKVPSSQLPSYADDVLEYSSESSFPATGESGKIYVDTTTNLTYRWSGSSYVEIGQSLTLGETSSTAYRGDRGKTAYDHSQSTHARTDATKTESSSTNGNIKINGNETTVYTHPNSGVTAGTYKSVTVDAKGHVTGGTNPTTLSGYGITDAVAKETGKGLSSNDYTTAEKNKLAGIETGANKTIVDDALSDISTNPVQNKVIKSEFDSRGISVINGMLCMTFNE